MLTSLCLPVHVTRNNSQVLQGVTCVDVTLDELFKDVTYFQQGRLSYAFILDRNARVFIHPLLPRPSDVEDDPILLYLPDIEQAREIPDLLQQMKTLANFSDG